MSHLDELPPTPSHVAEAAAALDRLAARAVGDEAFSRDVDVVRVALRQHEEAIAQQREERERAMLRQRRNHAAVMALARSESLGRGALDESLREITETASTILGVERSSVWIYDGDQTAILCLELFQRGKRTHESGIELLATSFPHYFAALKEERVIAAHDAHTDPHTREFTASYLAPLGIGAMLDAPIRVGGRMIGVLCNEHVGLARQWTIEEEQFAVSLADFIALAMESSQRRESEAQLRMMLEAHESAGSI